jgi:dipeptidyl aminopeptidase/acylaminoacyl peptidase
MLTRKTNLAWPPALMLALLGCSREAPDTPPAAQATKTADKAVAPTLIPREMLFGNPARFRGRLSPSGEQASYLAPVDGVMNIWVGPGADLDAAKPITNDKSRGIRSYQWSASDEYIIYLRDVGGDENDHVFSSRLPAGAARDLTPFAGARAEIYGMSWTQPGDIVIGINNRNPEYFDVYRVSLASGKRTLLFKNEGYAADYLNTTFLNMTPDNKAIYLITAKDRDKAALMAMSLADGSLTMVAKDDRADVEAVLLEPLTREVLAYSANYTRREWHAVQSGFDKHLASIATSTPGDMEVLGQSKDGNRWIFVSEAPDDPTPYYVYDRKTGKATRLFSSYPELAKQPLRRTAPVVILTRDGQSLVSYLTLPYAGDPDGDGKSDSRVPLVLNVHGGPWARDAFGYLAEHQWLANRGYAVLSVNYRGSTGFGKAFVEAAVHEWAGKMHNDLVDAADWAAREGITDRDKTAIMGWSYGGYATLTGLTFTPDRFACGVDGVGPSNLATLLSTIPPYWKAFFEVFARHVGDPRTAAGRALLQERSPLNRAGAIKRPLLIGQGANDPRVKQSESDQIVEAMKAKGLPVTYAVFPDEGHGFARPENNLAFYGIAEGFLHTCLGGRYEPLGDDLSGSSTTVPVGADIVPGLAQALDGFKPTVRK